MGALTRIVYVDRSDVRHGKAEELEAAIAALVKHLALSERRFASYAVYLTDDRSEMTVIHVHPDAESLEQLMEAIAPALPPFRELLSLRTIDVYGKPTEATLEHLRRKIELLGGTVTVHVLTAGIESGSVMGERVVGGEGLEPPTSSV